MVQNNELREEEQELYEHYRFNVDKGQGLLRIDKYLMSRIENASRVKIQSAALAGNILVNGTAVKSSYKVKPEDVVIILMSHPVRDFELIAENIPIEILFEDEDILIVNKPAGMVVHPAHGNYTGTLLNAILYHLKQTDKKHIENNHTPHLVHRIDKDTSGVMMLAKNEQAQIKIASQFYNHTIERKYVALVWGDVKDDKGTITGNIGRSFKNRKVYTVFPEGDYGKHAITHYKVLERFGYVTMIECQLETGRTHQIRVHMRYIGHPMFNDDNYGGSEILKGTTFSKFKQFVNNCFKICPRQALHARSLGFIHPTSGNKMFFEKLFPPDMEAMIEKWRAYAIHKAYGEE